MRHFTGSRAVHAFSVSLVRNVAKQINLRLDSEQWNVLFDYLTIPSTQMTQKDQFTHFRDFQYLALNNVRKRTHDAIETISSLQKAEQGVYFVFDRKSFFGHGAFEDRINRFVGYGDAEVALSLAQLHLRLHNILVFQSYSLDNFLETQSRKARMIGVDGWTSDMGVMDSDRIAAIKTHEKNGYLRPHNSLINEHGYLKSALEHLRHAVAQMDFAHRALQGRPSSFGRAVNPVFFQDENVSALKPAIDNLKNLVSGPAIFRSPLTGKLVSIDFPAFYNNPTNLMALLPTGFRTEEKNPRITGSDGKALVYRDYRGGQANAWNTQAWSRYLRPVGSDGKAVDAKEIQPDYILEMVRTLSAVEGVRVLAWPLRLGT